MPTKSRWTIDIPECSLPTLLFKSPSEPLPESRCFSDAARPDTHYLTRNSYRLWCQRFAVGLLKSKRFKKGDRILLFSGNDLLFPVVFLGTILAGGVFTGANPTYVARELAHQLRDSGATYLLCADSALDVGIAGAREAGLSTDQVFVYNSLLYDETSPAGTSPQKGVRYWGELVASAEESKDYIWDALTGPNECHTTLALNYSSGTTGVPKGVEITHYNYTSNTLQSVHLSQLQPDYLERNERTRWLCFLPMYHAMAQTVFIASALLREVPVYIVPRFDFLQVLGYVQQFKITDLIMVPPIAVALAKHPATKSYDLSTIEAVVCAAAPLSREVSAQVEALWPAGQVNLKQAFGMTEATCSLLGWDPREVCDNNSVGEPNANCEAKIMTESEESKPTEITTHGPSSRGELWVRGPNLMKGYWRNPTATAEAITPDGWLKTGDIAYVDEMGKFFIVDRRKELIKVKGHQVAPADLEALLLEHRAVADAAVIGLPGPDGDEAPKAYVVLQADEKSQATLPEEIQTFIESRVARHKRLTGGVTWIDAIPKNPSGKILRRWLRDKAREEMRAISKGNAPKL